MKPTNATLGALAMTTVLAACGGCGRETVVSLPPPEVSVAQPVEQEIQESLEFTGRTEAIEKVEVHARVQGYVTKVLFQAGAMVRQGDVLFEIDAREYEAAVLQAEGEVQRLRAVIARADAEVARTQRLRPSGAASEREVEKAIAEKGSAEGELKTALARLENARLDLEFTKVRSPIDGRVSREEITVGNLVAIGATGGPLLTTIVSVDPMYVYFDVDEPSILRFRRAVIERGGRADPESVRERKVPLWVGLANQQGFPHQGLVDFVDNRIDPATGTLRVRGVLANPDRYLDAGMFTRVRLPIGPPARGVLVADRAVGSDQDRKYLLVVNDQNVVEYRPVRLGPLEAGLRVVREGLAPGEWVIVDGIQRVRPAITVNPQRIAMRPAPAASPAATPAAS
jgi:RND family efflux transporter MFP subunit